MLLFYLGCLVFGMKSTYRTFSILCNFGNDKHGASVVKWLDVVACDITAARADISEAYENVSFVTYSVK